MSSPAKQNSSFISGVYSLNPLAFIILLFCFFQYNVFAQTTSGTVVDQETEEPLIGATVFEVGSDSNAALTDANGNFSIDVEPTSRLRISYVGYETKVINASNATNQIIGLTPSSAIEEVVVTALGITREEASLGYSVQEVGGSTLVQARENNVANSLSGKVSGLQVIRGSNGPASSSKIVLRGMSSLTGDNQPLIVVDGIPMDNFTGASNNDFWNPSPDMGNGLGDINPENIESISVLKSGPAAALYGSRGANGVVMITTKSGKEQEGLGITYSSAYGIQSNFLTPDYQNQFAQGSQGVYDPQSGASWGPKIEGQQVNDWNGNPMTLQSYDNLSSFLETGVNWSNSLSFQNKISDAFSMYSSISYLDDQSMLPGAALERLNVMNRSTLNFGRSNNWQTDVKIQYISNTADNRPFNGHPSSLKNTAAQVYTLPRNIDITNFSNPVNEFGDMVWYQPTSNSLNPYWGVEYDQNHDERDRFLLSGTVNNQITDWLTAELKGGADIYSTLSNAKLFSGGPNAEGGAYSTGDNSFAETNFSAMLTAQKDNVLGKLGGLAMLGGNLMNQKFENLFINAGNLEVPDFFEVNNGLDTPYLEKGFSHQKINSIYGQLQLNYNQVLFVDLTGRNDWSSTLNEDNRSFFYPSVSTSFVLSDMLDNNSSLPTWLDFAKVRVSYSEVGNSLNPYELYPYFQLTTTPNGVRGAKRNNILFNPDLVNELKKEFETGFNARFLNNRVGVDFSYYKSNTTNQLMELPLNPLSGYSRFKANAGNIQNQGIELITDIRVMETDQFTWDSKINFSRNRNKIVELTEEVSLSNLITLDALRIVAFEGERFGQIYGSKYARVEDKSSPYYGQKILNEAGLPTTADGSHLLGTQEPDALVGFSNSFSWKGLDVGILLDGRFGGKIYSGTNRTLKQLGLLDKTAENGREDFIVDGVTVDDDGNYIKNTEEVSPQVYWNHVSTVGGNLGVVEENIYDATNIRIRNVYANYQLPSHFASNLKMQNLKIGVSVNNLAMLSSELNGVDPESVYAISSNAVGYESLSAPTPRTMFFNISANF